MAPLVALVCSWIVFCIAGLIGFEPLDNGFAALRWAVAVMFAVTASAHWGRLRRNDLIAMVPPAFPNPALLVGVTGWLELAGAAGLLIPAFAPVAAAGLALLLVAMFPANVYAARSRLKLAGKPVMPVFPRTVLQIVFLGVTLAAGFGNA